MGSGGRSETKQFKQKTKTPGLFRAAGYFGKEARQAGWLMKITATLRKEIRKI